MKVTHPNVHLSHLSGGSFNSFVFNVAVVVVSFISHFWSHEFSVTSCGGISCLHLTARGNVLLKLGFCIAHSHTLCQLDFVYHGNKIKDTLLVIIIAELHTGMI